MLTTLLSFVPGLFDYDRWLTLGKKPGSFLEDVPGLAIWLAFGEILIGFLYLAEVTESAFFDITIKLYYKIH